MTKGEIIAKIKSIAFRSSNFKIGETGQELEKRLAGYNKQYSEIQLITWSKDKTVIDTLENQMISHFIKWKNNDNEKTGSAGEMPENSEKYKLYVVYNPKVWKK